jgi:hypothetical protein
VARYFPRMPHSAAFPFTLRRSHDVVGLSEILSTTRTVHGLYWFAGELARSTPAAR